MGTKIQYINYDDYRFALKDRFFELKNIYGNHFNSSDLAGICGLQRTYFSKVINSRAHLNEDQLFEVLEYLKFNDKEKEYLTILSQSQKSQNAIRKELLAKDALSLRKKFLKFDNDLVMEKVSTRDEIKDYFLDPFIQIVHIFCTIPKYAKNPERIRDTLELELLHWQNIINSLLSMKLIEINDNQIKVVKDSFFLASDDSLAKSYHILAKNNANFKLPKLNDSNKNSFSTVFSCSEKSWLKIRSLYKQTFLEMEKIVANDKNESGVYQLSFDLFPWTDEGK